jgi:hypothetical protein
MNVLILVGLLVAVLLASVVRSATGQPQPPQVIYLQAAPTEPARGAGCLPLLVLLGVILLAVFGLR